MNMKTTSKDKNVREKSCHDVKQTRKHSSKKKTTNDVVKSAIIIARQKMKEKHQTNEHSMNIKLINDIIYNEKAHIVTEFKDFLIFDDSNEFLKRFYKNMESIQKLPQIFEFYETFSKIFANYINLPESKYMYKNIQRKQKMIDNLQNKVKHEQSHASKESENKIFNTEIYNSIINQSEQFDDSIANQHTIERMRLTSEIESLRGHLELDLSQKSRKQDSSVFGLEKLVDSIGRAERGPFAELKYDEKYCSMIQKTEGTMRQKTRQKLSKKIAKDYPENLHAVTIDNNRLKNRNMRFKDILNLRLNSHQMLPFSMKNPTEDKTEINSKEKSKVNLNCKKPDIVDKNDKGQETDRKDPSSILTSCLKKKFNTLSVKKSAQFNKKIRAVTDKLERASITNRENKEPESVETERRVKPKVEILGSNQLNSNHDTIVASLITGGNHHTKIIHSPEIRDQKADQWRSYGPLLNKLTTNNILNNFQILSNYQSNAVPHSPQINIYNNVAVNSEAKLPEKVNNLIVNLVNINNHRPENVEVKSDIIVNAFHNSVNPDIKLGEGLSKPPAGVNGPLSTTKKNTQGNNEMKRESIYRYIQTYTSDISKFKKKVLNLVKATSNLMSSKAKKGNTQNNTGNSSGMNTRRDHTLMIYPNTNVNTCNGTLGTTGNVSLTLQNNSPPRCIVKKNQIPKETNLREIIHRDLFDGEEACEKVLRKNVIENTKVYHRQESKIRDNLISIERTNPEAHKDKCGTINNNSSNNITKTISQTTNLTDRKNCTPSGGLMSNVIMNSSNIFNNFNSPQNRKLETIMHNKMRSLDSQRFSVKAEVSKNMMKVFYPKSSTSNINKITNASNPHTNAHSNSKTPKKKEHKARIIHRPAKSNFFTGSGTIQNHKVFGNIQETAKKPQEKKEVIVVTSSEGENMNNTLTPNPENKFVLKIKNFYEIVKSNAIVPSANSARSKCSNKAEVRLNPNNKKEKVILK